jgi:hypothetical protein
MRILLLIIFIIFLNRSFAQDTIRNVDIIIYKNDRIIQKEFKSSKNYIKIIYEYDEFGTLIRRYWYNKEGELLGVSLDD